MKDTLRLKFITENKLEPDIILGLASDFYSDYALMFKNTPSKFRMDFIKSFSSIMDKEYKILFSLNNKYKKIIKRVGKSSSVKEITKLHQNLNELSAEIFLTTNSVKELHNRCTYYRDKINLKVIDLTKKEMSRSSAKPKNTFAWLRMGSSGREEQTLITDQDNLLVYKNKDDKQYYRDFAKRMVDNLAVVGFTKCKGAIMPVNEKWFGTLTQWRSKLHTYIVDSDNLIDLIVLTDAKYSGGNYPLAQAFINESRKVLKMYHSSFKAIAQATVLMPIALTIFKNFKTEKHGEYKDMLNIKFQGWLPLIMLTLLFSLENNIWETNTVSRIKCLEKLKRFDTKMAGDLIETYLTLTSFKIKRQIEFIENKINKMNYFINPYKLDKNNRIKLKKALSIVENFRRLALSSYNIKEDKL